MLADRLHHCGTARTGSAAHIHEDADERIIGAADSVMLAPRGMLRSLVNVGPGASRFVVVLSAPGFEGYWREMADVAVRSSGSPDPEVVRALQRKYRMNTGGAVRRLE